MATKQGAVELWGTLEGRKVDRNRKALSPPRSPAFTSLPLSTTLLEAPTVMRDLANPQLIKAKGIMFFVVGLIAAMLLILEQPSLRIALLLSICVWCFCRAYYFAFYVIEHYVDPGYRFSG